ncbi:hypothetical protein GCM10010520_60220 [Rhizobium viscosum]|uniref:DUF4145 domain-containing protein n=1 Tax=Rhizobium viscosum TaxID=1673 RepID=A0ABR9IUN1_RHIVS|nr:DUF4145 domain-containing protein [Rhizobium viscosum]MBE1506914.1 hypothetical protein [Rhizobium viscosum]
MNYLDFFASVLSSLSWPAAIVAVALIFRKEIRSLLPRVRFRHKDTEIDFRLEEAEKAAESLPPPAHELPPPTPEEEDRFERLARISPTSAILELRRSAEEAIKIFARSVPRQHIGGARQILRGLRSANEIDPAAANLLDEILTIGNIAAHESGASFTYDDAIRYRALAQRAIEMIATAVERDANA